MLHGLKQVISFDLLDLHIRIADDAERMHLDYSHAGEKRRYIGGNNLFKPDKIMMMGNGPVFARPAR